MCTLRGSVNGSMYLTTLRSGAVLLPESHDSNMQYLPLQMLYVGACPAGAILLPGQYFGACPCRWCPTQWQHVRQEQCGMPCCHELPSCLPLQHC
jgi:hypothetical protein